ncbi:HipA-like C-terminal domain-containing protein [Desulfonatronum thiosulfatophilum]|uniref:HipA-like C-terminal domain-containing protein n=1 Tax=Desulfonatronum thiosulfatophilum TaxID=617002 RepID=A0A1G6D4W5_9BACT|nr:HipA N-terminal domain-containing protein [Desulfonatronum thiosulfatophilum]SDB40203.1 HipA-like C-terminal domain-containing protein [Desulfonatronum thiosulfatophilum]
MPKEIFVHVDLRDGPFFVGTLWVHTAKGRQSATFEYASAWRSCAAGFSLEPALELRKGTFHTDKAMFGAIGDSAPDRWGRTLMNRREARLARLEKRTPRMLREAEGWRLSPLYDLEPTPEHVKPRILHTRIDYHDGTASLELAFDVAGEFGVEPREAEFLAETIAAAVQCWEDEGLRWRASRQEIEFKRSAFELGR